MRSRALRVRWGNDRERGVVNRALGAADARHWTDPRNALEWVPKRRTLGRRPDPSVRSRDGARTNDGCRRGRRTEHPVLVWRPRANVTGCGGRRGAPGRPARDDRERLVGGCGSARRGARRGGLRLRRRRDPTGRGGRRRGNGRGGRSRGHRLADRLRRHRRRRRRRGRRRQELQRIGIPLRLGRDADAQMDVRLSDLDLTGGTDGGNGLPVDDGRVLGDFDRPEVGQRHGVPVGRDDRQALARGRDGAREGDRPGRGRHHGTTRGRPDVETAVLPGGIRVSWIEDERLEDWAVHRPRPRSRRSCVQQCGDYRREQDSAHRPPPVRHARGREFPANRSRTCVLKPR